MQNTSSPVQAFATVLLAAVVFALGLVLLTAPPAQTGLFDPQADLDISTVDYVGFQPGQVGLAAGTDVLEYGA